MRRRKFCNVPTQDMEDDSVIYSREVQSAGYPTTAQMDDVYGARGNYQPNQNRLPGRNMTDREQMIYNAGLGLGAYIGGGVGAVYPEQYQEHSPSIQYESTMGAAMNGSPHQTSPRQYVFGSNQRRTHSTGSMLDHRIKRLNQIEHHHAQHRQTNFQNFDDYGGGNVQDAYAGYHYPEQRIIYGGGYSQPSRMINAPQNTGMSQVSNRLKMLPPVETIGKPTEAIPTDDMNGRVTQTRGGVGEPPNPSPEAGGGSISIQKSSSASVKIQEIPAQIAKLRELQAAGILTETEVQAAINRSPATKQVAKLQDLQAAGILTATDVASAMERIVVMDPEPSLASHTDSGITTPNVGVAGDMAIHNDTVVPFTSAGGGPSSHEIPFESSVYPMTSRGMMIDQTSGLPILTDNGAGVTNDYSYASSERMNLNDRLRAKENFQDRTGEWVLKGGEYTIVAVYDRYVELKYAMSPEFSRFINQQDYYRFEKLNQVSFNIMQQTPVVVEHSTMVETEVPEKPTHGRRKSNLIVQRLQQKAENLGLALNFNYSAFDRERNRDQGDYVPEHPVEIDASKKKKMRKHLRTLSAKLSGRNNTTFDHFQELANIIDEVSQQAETLTLQKNLIQSRQARDTHHLSMADGTLQNQIAETEAKLNQMIHRAPAFVVPENRYKVSQSHPPRQTSSNYSSGEHSTQPGETEFSSRANTSTFLAAYE